MKRYGRFFEKVSHQKEKEGFNTELTETTEKKKGRRFAQ